MTGVVLVDDQSDVVALMEAIVTSRSDVEVLGTASNGPDAIEVVRRLHPDLVVIDHHMPTMTGVAAARCMLEDQPGLRILLCTAYLDDQVRDEAISAGIVRCLPKDRIGDLGSALQQLAA